MVRPALSLFFFFSILTGVVYPWTVTGVGQLVFPRQANGSAIVVNGRVLGSSLIGQSFESARYFWGRPSATAAFPYDASASSGSNLGPTNPALFEAREKRASIAGKDAPADLLASSASGLDPHISPEAAYYQAARVAEARRISVGEVEKLIARYLEPRTFGVFGEPRVNVLELNLALDQAGAP